MKLRRHIPIPSTGAFQTGPAFGSTPHPTPHPVVGHFSTTTNLTIDMEETKMKNLLKGLFTGKNTKVSTKGQLESLLVNLSGDIID